MKTRAFLFDMDGVMFLHPPFVERLWFQSLQAFINSFLSIAEFISIFTGKVNPKMWEILGQKDESIVFGITTDRTLLSTLVILWLHKIPLNSFDVIQTRRNCLNRFALLFLTKTSPIIWESELKANQNFLKNPRSFCFEKGIWPQNIWVIDDRKDVREIAQELGLQTATSLDFIHFD